MKRFGWTLFTIYAVLWVPCCLFMLFVIGMSDGKVLEPSRLSQGMWSEHGSLSVPFAGWAVLVVNPLLVCALAYLVSKLFSRNKVP